jgi:hypothetical protein
VRGLGHEGIDMSDRIIPPENGDDEVAQAAELERLRARAAELEAQVEAIAPSRTGPETRVSRGRWRSIVASGLIVVACLLAPLSVVSVWASQQISDTDRYVQTVAPLAQNPEVQSAITDEITNQIFTYIDVAALIRQALDALNNQGLSPEVSSQLQGLSIPLTSAVENFTRDQVAKIVASPQFATAWDAANRAAHEQLVALLSGEQGGAISAQNDSVTINLGPFIAQAKEQLVAQGFSAARNIPEVDKSFTMVQSGDVTKLQRGYRLLNDLGAWLPWIALALFGIGVYVAKSHRRAIIAGGLGVAASMLVLGAAITIARALYLNAVPADALPPDTAAAVFDTLVRFLRQALRATGIAFLLLAAGAFFTGGSETAERTRAVLRSGIGTLRGGAESAGLQTGRFGAWVYAHKRALRIGVVVLGMLALTFWPNATVGDVIFTAVIVLLAVGVIEFLGRPPGTQEGTSETASSSDQSETVPADAAVSDEGPGGDEPTPGAKD